MSGTRISKKKVFQTTNFQKKMSPTLCWPTWSHNQEPLSSSKVFVKTDFKFTKYFWFAEKIVLFFEITRCTLLLKKTTAVDSISLFVVGALANCNQERPGLRLISLLNSLLCWNFWEVLKFQSFDYLNSTSYIVLLLRILTQPQQPRNIVRCESDISSLSDWALPVQGEKI